MTARTDSPSAEVKLRAFKRDRFRCVYCGAPGTEAELEADHIIPVAKGGSHHVSNLATACRKCNQAKSDGAAPPRCLPMAAKPVLSGLVGMFLWTLHARGTPNLQGTVVSVDGDVALVQLFSWLDGRPTQVEAIAKSQLLDSSMCRLFATNQNMLDEYDRNYERFARIDDEHLEQIERAEQ